MAKPKIMFDKTEIVANATVVGEMNKKSQKILRLNNNMIMLPAENSQQAVFISLLDKSTN